MTLNDAILAATGGPTVNDGLRAYYLANGAVSGALPDLERQFLLANGGVSGTTQDMWMGILSAAGYTGTLNDMLYQFWLDGGSLGFDPMTLSPTVYFDPSDLSTLFQNTQGTTPVTASGQPVGLMLDKSQGLASGAEIAVNGGFDNNGTGWTQGVAGSDFVGGKLNLNVPASNIVNSAATTVVGAVYRLSFEVSNYVSGDLSISFGGVSISATANGTHVREYAAATSTVSLRVLSNGSPVCSVDNISLKRVAGNHASQATSTKRPQYQTDGTYHWLQGDGVDDFMQTGNIDLTATDKVSVFAGVTNNATAAAMPYCFGNNPVADTGAFGQYFRGNANGDYAPAARQSVQFYATTPIYPIPDKRVTTQFVDFARIDWFDALKLRLDGVQQRLTHVSGGNMGQGNFGTWPLFLLSRSGTEFFNSGRLYPLIIVPRLTTTEETADAEKWVAEKTGVTLPSFVARYAYSTPASGTIPTAGQLIHADNVINKWNISRTDLDGNVITGGFLENGDTMVLNGVTYTLEAEQFFTDYIALTIEPTTQQPDGTYSIGVYT